MKLYTRGTEQQSYPLKGQKRRRSGRHPQSGVDSVFSLDSRWASAGRPVEERGGGDPTWIRELVAKTDVSATGNSRHAPQMKKNVWAFSHCEDFSIIVDTLWWRVPLTMLPLTIFLTFHSEVVTTCQIDLVVLTPVLYISGTFHAMMIQEPRLGEETAWRAPHLRVLAGAVRYVRLDLSLFNVHALHTRARRSGSSWSLGTSHDFLQWLIVRLWPT